MIDKQNFFDYPVNLIWDHDDNVWMIVNGQRGD